MFLLDSLMISGISWTLKTVLTTAEAEMNDDTALREQLLAAAKHETGEITDEDYVEIERDLLARIREINERREGGSGPLAFGDGEPIESTADSRFQIEATVSGDFHQPENAPHTTVVETEPARGGIIGSQTGRTLSVLDVEPIHAETLKAPALPRPATKRRRSLVPSRRRATASPRAPKAKPRRRTPSANARAKAGKIRKS